MPDLTRLTAANAARFKACKVKPGKGFPAVAARLVQAKARYMAVEAATGVPWFIVAVIHERESSQNWNTQLAQGDPLDKPSTHVPKGRGPFPTWEEGAHDALVDCPPYAARWKDWSAGGALTLLEQYNGLGYYNRGVPSPYLWAGTDQYDKGKYVADGVYDPTVEDKQLGCAGLLISMQGLDYSIKFAVSASAPAASPVVPPPQSQQPVPPSPAPQSGSWFASLLIAIFKAFRRGTDQ